MDNLTFLSVNDAFVKAEVADDAFVANYVELLKHHLTTKLGKNMRANLEALLKQAQEKPQEVKDRFTPLLVKPVIEVIDGN